MGWCSNHWENQLGHCLLKMDIKFTRLKFITDSLCIGFSLHSILACIFNWFPKENIICDKEDKYVIIYHKLIWPMNEWFWYVLIKLSYIHYFNVHAPSDENNFKNMFILMQIILPIEYQRHTCKILEIYSQSTFVSY